MNRIIPFLCVFTLLLSGCAFPLLPSSIIYSGPERKAFADPVGEPVVQAPQVLELTVIEGKTTKQEIINALGTPKSMFNLTGNEQLMVYYFSEYTKLLCWLRLTQKDGTVWNDLLGQGKVSSLQITVKGGIVRTVDFTL